MGARAGGLVNCFPVNEAMVYTDIYRYTLWYFMFIQQVCNALNKAKIPYAIVGGYAVALHGAPRGTFDVDFIIEWSLSNIQKTEKALKSLGLVSRLPLDAEAVFHFRDEYIHKRNLIAWNFYDPINPSRQVDFVIAYDLSKKTTKRVKTAEGNIKILSRPDLIAMKKASGRPQDLEDVRSMEQL